MIHDFCASLGVSDREGKCIAPATTKLSAPDRPYALSPEATLAKTSTGDTQITYNNGVRSLPIHGNLVSVWRIGDLIVPFFGLDAEADDFSYIVVE